MDKMSQKMKTPESAQDSEENPGKRFGLPLMEEPLWKRYYSEGWLFHQRIENLLYLRDPLPEKTFAERWHLLLITELLLACIFAIGYQYGNAPKIAIEYIFKIIYSKNGSHNQKDLNQIAYEQTLSIQSGRQSYSGKLASAEEAAKFLKQNIPNHGESINLIEGCKDWKLTQTWMGSRADEIGCRLSKDKSRLWVWGFIDDGYNGKKPVFTVFRYGKWTGKDSEHFEIRQISGDGLRDLPGIQSINQRDVVNALNQDFKELTTY